SEVGVGVRNLVYALCDLVPLGVAGALGHRTDLLVELGGAGVVGLVDAMAHAHQLALGGQGVVYELVNLVHVAYLHQHLHGLLVGPAVRPAVEGGDGGHDAREVVGQRRDGDHRGEGRGVQAVLGGQHEIGVQRAGVFGRRVLTFEHVEQVGG